MRIAVSSDLDEPVAWLGVAELRLRGHIVTAHGALGAGDRGDWTWSAESGARCVVTGAAIADEDDRANVAHLAGIR